MKKYKEYMDNVKASDTLHRRLLGLEVPAKRPIPWKRYGTMAAALVLVCGLGGFAAWAAHINSQTGPIPHYPSGYQGTNPEIASEPDIALVSPGDVAEPAKRTLGGYDVTTGSGENAMVTHYILPYIEYGDVSGTAACLDWDIPKGATRRDLNQEEIVTLLGGEDAVNTHLDWGDYELTGWAARYEDGSFWGAYIQGYKGPLDHFEFAVTAGHLPPTCIAFPESVTQEIRGLTVTADGHDSVATPSGGVDASSRRVSFMKDDYGYRFDLTGTSRALTEERVSRLVCRVADKGLNLDFTGTVAMSPPTLGEDGLYTCEICGRDYPVGSAHGHPFMGAGEPDYDAPPVSVSDSPRSKGEDWCGTPGADPDDAMCSGYPVPEVCPICGETFPAGTDHSHEVCHLPLASDPAESWEISDGHPLAPEGWTGPYAAPNCEVCGQPIQAGVEHSHHNDHHSEHH